MNLPELITSHRNKILEDWGSIGFKQMPHVKWAIEFGSEYEKEFYFQSISFYPKIIQYPSSDEYSVWFEFNISFTKDEQDKVIKFLSEKFEKLKFKPVCNGGIHPWLNTFSIQYAGYFTKPRQILEIRKDHPLYENYGCKFFISPDYPQVILESEPIVVEGEL